MSHIGAVAQLIHNAFFTVSCSQYAWETFSLDAHDKVKNFLYELNFRASDLKELFEALNKKTKTFTFDEPKVRNFLLSSLRRIQKIKTRFTDYNSSLNTIDVQVKKSIDDMMMHAYRKSIHAIVESIDRNKSCVTNIIAAQNQLYDGFEAGIHTCSDKLVQFEIESNLANIIRRVTVILIALSNCTELNMTTEIQSCLEKVSHHEKNIKVRSSKIYISN